MFCQQCGASAPDQSKFCKQCGHRFKPEPRISNKALLIAAIAAIVSIGTALLGFFPKSEPTTAQGPIAIASQSPSVSVTPKISPSPKPTRKPRQTPEPTPDTTPRPQRQRPEPTPDYPFRHTPILLSPNDGVLFSYRYALGRLLLRWRRTPTSEADRYKVEIEHGNLSHQPPWLLREFETPWDYCTVEFTDMRTVDFAGRWRVIPILTGGRSGIPTEWRTFRFTQ
jgi:hypothetical protein